MQFTVEASAVLLPALLVFLGLTLRRVRRPDHPWTGRHAALLAVAALYTAAVLAITVFPLEVTYGPYANQAPWYTQINVIPLITLDATAVPNVIMFVPLGFLLPLLTRAAGLWQVTARAAVASLAIESTQLLLYVVTHNGRSADINDLLVNTLGGVAGYGCLTLALSVPSLRRALSRGALPGSGGAAGHGIRAAA
ncbi:VanZ family protein [Streptomyces zingiberis]|uniref:VanZ family protein n=1 Tax=Streptomyces zingiberis TaxID=2053010 RepID=A0ABX1BTF6_9ACTN|nr:VanZ family protein [Streptomyces zingiberis]NJP99492.1 VanZ family protein [Streptomyces zingiberis]